MSETLTGMAYIAQLVAGIAPWVGPAPADDGVAVGIAYKLISGTDWSPIGPGSRLGSSPLFSIVAFATEGDTEWMANLADIESNMDAALNASSGAVTRGFVRWCEREQPIAGSEPLHSGGTRHFIGGLYRLHVSGP